MPPVKREIRLRIDGDLADYLEALKAEIQGKVPHRTIYFSRVINAWIRASIEHDKKNEKSFTQAVYADLRALSVMKSFFKDNL